MISIQILKRGLWTASLALLLTPGLFGGEDNPQPGPEPYPLDTCVVSGMKLGSMGEPYVHHTADGTEVRFCCKGCLPAFEKSPENYLEKIEAAAEKNSAPGPQKDKGES
jgi:YHS domain-containing protein